MTHIEHNKEYIYCTIPQISSKKKPILRNQLTRFFCLLRIRKRIKCGKLAHRPWLINRAMYPTKIKKCVFVGKRFLRSEIDPSPREDGIVFIELWSVDEAIYSCCNSLIVKFTSEGVGRVESWEALPRFHPLIFHSNVSRGEKQKEQKWRTYQTQTERILKGH